MLAREESRRRRVRFWDHEKGPLGRVARLNDSNERVDTELWAGWNCWAKGEQEDKGSGLDDVGLKG